MSRKTETHCNDIPYLLKRIAEPESADSYSGQFKLRIPKSLHKTLAEDSKAPLKTRLDF
ncbi:MAG: toxin-antitoxin system HicB family antitoxin [Treponema sp.]